MMKSAVLVRAGMLLGVAVAIQSLRLGQILTGPAVNAVLFLAPGLVGTTYAVLIGFMTPWIAFVLGVVNPALGPAMPLIGVGNAVLVLAFIGTRKYIGPFAILSAAGAKYLIISSGATRILGLEPPLSLVLGTPQLFTALAGGALAWIITSVFRKTKLDFYRVPPISRKNER